MGEAMVTTQPSAKNYIIKRPRLTKLLDDSTARIILLCAPAGYGKTTLAREWVATRSEQVAWYSGGLEMLDAAAVATGLAQSLQRAGMPERVATRITGLAAQGAGPEALGRELAAGVPHLAESLLVIDDYHYAESTESEELVSTLVAGSEGRVLLTSRVRPRWMTSRMRVYGDAIVVGLNELAFTEDEARKVLASDVPTPPTELMAQARGWPAVIGLAARRRDTGGHVEDSLLPAELYEYFADDLFEQAPARLRESLYVLALGGDVDLSLTQELLGATCEAHLSEAADRGFITRSSTRELGLHPLLRAFLLAKLHEVPAKESDRLVVRTLEHLASARHWDECLATLTEFPNANLAGSLLQEALPDLLASGRLATVKRWLTLAAQEGSSAVVLLAEAEIALREGLDAHAQVVAERAAGLSRDHELSAQAHLVAARAAHLRGDGAAAKRNAETAAKLSGQSQTQIAAQWMDFLTAFEVQDASAWRILETLRRADDASPAHALRLVTASAFMLIEANADVRGAIHELELGWGLLTHVGDPLIRTNYLNLFSSASVYFAEYERSLELATQLIEDARSTGLDFAADHALRTRATAFVGLRKISSAQRVLQELAAKADSASTFVMGQTKLTFARMKVAAGDLERAELTLRADPPSDLPPAFHGEWIGSRSLYLAALGSVAPARRAALKAKRVSNYLDAHNLGDLALAIVGLRESDDDNARRKAVSVVSRIIAGGHCDAVVLACRAYPHLAVVCAKSQTLVRELTPILAGSRDIDIGRAAGLDMPREVRRSEGLSRRERDVYELVVQGRTNRKSPERCSSASRPRKCMYGTSSKSCASTVAPKPRRRTSTI